MGTCGGTTAKGGSCRKPGIFENDGSLFCHFHVPKSVDLCAICLDPLYNTFTTPCNHLFHTVCIARWVRLNAVCPVCRGPCSPYIYESHLSDILNGIVSV